MALWIVRAGSEGEQEQSALDNGIVIIDWNMPDLSDLKKKSDLRNLYSKLHPDQKKVGIANSVGQIWDFKLYEGLKEIDKLKDEFMLLSIKAPLGPICI